MKRRINMLTFCLLQQILECGTDFSLADALLQTNKLAFLFVLYTGRIKQVFAFECYRQGRREVLR